MGIRISVEAAYYLKSTELDWGDREVPMWKGITPGPAVMCVSSKYWEFRTAEIKRWLV